MDNDCKNYINKYKCNLYCENPDNCLKCDRNTNFKGETNMTKVWVLTISAIGEDTHYEVYDKRSKAELAAKVHEDSYRLTEADFETLKSYAKGITADTLDEWLEEDLDDIGQLNSYGLWSISELNSFLKENDYEIEGELECMDV